MTWSQNTSRSTEATPTCVCIGQGLQRSLCHGTAANPCDGIMLSCGSPVERRYTSIVENVRITRARDIPADIFYITIQGSCVHIHHDGRQRWDYRKCSLTSPRIGSKTATGNVRDNSKLIAPHILFADPPPTCSRPAFVQTLHHGFADTRRVLRRWLDRVRPCRTACAGTGFMAIDIAMRRQEAS